MWLILPTGFLSIVQDRKNPDEVWVRGRVRDDIARAFPEYEDDIITKIGADYIYRLKVTKEEAAIMLASQVFSLDYTSHAKEEMNRRSAPHPQRMSTYYSIWTALSRLQPVRPYAHKMDRIPETTSATLPDLPKPRPIGSSSVGLYGGHGGGYFTDQVNGPGYAWNRNKPTQAAIDEAVDLDGVEDDFADLPDEAFALSEADWDALMVSREAERQDAKHVRGKARRGRRGGRNNRKGGRK